jgi:hypothetical protein
MKSSPSLSAINKVAPRSSSALLTAVQSNNILALQQAISEGEDINLPILETYTLLHIAARKGFINITHALLKAGASPYLKASKGFTPLHLAAQNGHQGVVQALLETNKNLAIIKAEKGVLPLHLAIACDRLEVAQTLLAMGPPQVELTIDGGHSALRFAILRGNKSMVDLLLKNHCTVTQEDVRAAKAHLSEIAKDVEDAYLLQQNTESITYGKPIMECLQPTAQAPLSLPSTPLKRSLEEEALFVPLSKKPWLNRPTPSIAELDDDEESAEETELPTSIPPSVAEGGL